MYVPKSIALCVEKALGEKIVHADAPTSLSGGEALKIQTPSESYFLKYSTGPPRETFLKEARGLRELAKARGVSVVRVIKAMENFLLLDFIPPHRPERNFFPNLGRGLARMHRFCQDICGLGEDNFLGASVQVNINREARPWAEFFWQKRLLFQWEMAVGKNLVGRELTASFEKLKPIVFELLNFQGPYSLLHGDLWNGNFMVGPEGKALLIDPAIYYGHREAELAMMKLFGGFPQEVFEAYEREFPLEAGHQKRLGLYQLYHLLNHLNLFGQSYLGQVRNIILNYTQNTRGETNAIGP